MAAGQRPPPLLAIGDLANGAQPPLSNGGLGVAPLASIGSSAVRAPSAEAASHRCQPEHRSVTDADGSRDAGVQDNKSDPCFLACMPDV